MNIDLSIWKDEYLPVEVILKSYATNANILCNIKGKGLLLINNDDAWNMLYPFYATTINKHDFKEKTVRGILSEYKNIAESKGITEKYKKKKLIDEFMKYYEIEKCRLSEEICKEHWIKFSKTANEWRLYIMNFYLLKDAKNVESIANKRGIRQVFLPFEGETFDKVLKTGEYEGIRIVDNVIKILKDEVLLEKIRSVEVG